MIIHQIQRNIFPGAVIPKPRSNKSYIVKGWGTSRGESALVYLTPKKPGSKKQASKRIRVSDFRKAHSVLISTGEFTREWFNKNLPDCAKDGGCNFTTIGGIFVLLRIAEYIGEGIYSLK